ncbi:MAG: PIG-L family deacetylase [Thiotrichaceae bacterium]|nr:PIG-L family deacetylase [Thiotrichaceae bacterium]
MIPETDILPYSCAELATGPWLVFSPHPDDESFGMGGTLLLAKQKAITVSLIIVTDGSLGVQNACAANSIINDRKNELINAAQQLGIKNLYFLDLPDRKVTINKQIISKVQTIIEKVSPASIFFPSVLEPHPDHRATALLAAQVLSQLNQPYSAYSYDISVQSTVNTLIDISSVQKKKVEIMELYESQLSQNNYIDVINALNKARTYTLDSRVEFAEGFFQYKNFSQFSLAQQIYTQLELFWQSQQVAEENLIDNGLKGDNNQLSEELYDLKEHYKELSSQHEKLKAEIKAIYGSRTWKFLCTLRSFLVSKRG